MKRYIYFIAALLILAATAWCVIRVPASRPYHFGVSFSQRGYQTNTIGTIVPIFAVTNGGLRKVDVLAGTEFGVHAIDFSGSLQKTLQPGEEMLVPILPSRAYPQSRPVLQRYKYYGMDVTGRAARWFDVYLMKRKVTGYVYLAENAK